jgi:hypothetical protein
MNHISRSYMLKKNCTEGGSIVNGTSYTTYCCEADLCNEASMEKATFSIAVIAALMGLLLIK